MGSTRIHQRLKEDTPSKEDIEAGQHIPGYPLRPEDDPRITRGDKGIRRVLINRRRGKTTGNLASRSTGEKRMERQMGSPILTQGEREALFAKYTAKVAKGTARKIRKGEALPGHHKTKKGLDSLTIRSKKNGKNK